MREHSLSKLVEKATIGDEQAALLLANKASEAGYSEKEIDDAPDWEQVELMILHPKKEMKGIARRLREAHERNCRKKATKDALIVETPMLHTVHLLSPYTVEEKRGDVERRIHFRTKEEMLEYLR